MLNYHLVWSKMMEQLKAELSAVIARYVPQIDPDSIEVTLQRGESNDHLKADIPLRRAPIDHNEG